MSDEAIYHFSDEAKGKVEKNQLVIYDEATGNIPEQMKVFQISALPYKSKAFQSILDLSFLLRVITHGCAPLVNENIKKTALRIAMDQIGTVVMRLIHTFAESPECAKIFQEKWDIKDGFWRIDSKKGEEWNLCYVLPHKPCMPIMLVVSTPLYMGWIE